MIFKSGSSKSKSATLSDRIDALDREITTSAAAMDELKSRRRAAILDGDDTARAVIEDAITLAERKAKLQAERREILVSEYEAALEHDAREEFARRHAAQLDANAKAAASAQKAFRRAWGLIAPALRELAEARAATDILNKAAPDGFAMLSHADDLARSAPSLPRADVSAKTVELWCFAETGNRVGGDQNAVQGGVLQVGPGVKPQRCIRKSFRHIRFHPAENAQFAPPISTELRFPRWDAAGSIFDGAFVVPDGVAVALNAIEENERVKSARPILEEFIAIDDTASDAA